MSSAQELRPGSTLKRTVRAGDQGPNESFGSVAESVRRRGNRYDTLAANCSPSPSSHQ